MMMHVNKLSVFAMTSAACLPQQSGAFVVPAGPAAFLRPHLQQRGSSAYAKTTKLHMVRRRGEGGYIRIQNKSSNDITIDVKEGRNVDDMGMDGIQGAIAPGAQLPVEGTDPFDDGSSAVYQYIESDVKWRFQKDGHFTLEASAEDTSPSSLKVVCDYSSWDFRDETPDADSALKMVADVDEDDDSWKIEIRVYDHVDPASWMSHLEESIADTPLNEVGLPGTHDSGTYAFDEDKGASPDSDLTSTIQDTLDDKGRLLGKLSDLILRTVFERLCRCQDLSVKEQLQAGIRYLDLRICNHEETGELWTCHGVFCVNINEILQEIKEFLDENPKEIVILDFNHFYDLKDEQHDELAASILEVLGDKAAERDAVGPTSTVGEFWENGYQAVILYQKTNLISDDKKNKVWTMYPSIQSPWPNAGDTDELHDKLQEKFSSRDMEKFYVLQGLLTPDVELIKNSLLDGDGVSMKTFADRCSPKIIDWCEDEWMDSSAGNPPMNIVIVDFFETCSLIPSILNFNRKA